MPQKIIVTTCPWKDYKTGKWMLSAMMNIQLETAAETTLAAFPDILKWMEKFSRLFSMCNGIVVHLPN